MLKKGECYHELRFLLYYWHRINIQCF